MSIDSFRPDQNRAALEWLRNRNARLHTETQRVIYKPPPGPRHLHLVKDESLQEPITYDRAPVTFEYFHPDPFKKDQPLIEKVEEVPDLTDLTEQESFILIQTARGFKVREISMMRRAKGSINLKSIYKKYGVESATQAVSLAIKHGAITEEMFQNTEGKKDFNIAKFEPPTDLEEALLLQLTNLAKTSTDEEIGEKVLDEQGKPLNKRQVAAAFSRLTHKYNLKSRTHLAAFYLLAIKETNTTQESTPKPDNVPHSSIRELPKSDEIQTALTPHEQEIVRLMAKGLHVKEIAKTVGRSSRTIDAHRRKIFKKYGVNEATHAVVKGIQEGVISMQQLEADIDLGKVGRLTDTQIAVLEAITDIEQPGTNKELNTRLTNIGTSVETQIKHILQEQSLINKAHLAAFYELSKAKGLL